MADFSQNTLQSSSLLALYQSRKPAYLRVENKARQHLNAVQKFIDDEETVTLKRDIQEFCVNKTNFEKLSSEFRFETESTETGTLKNREMRTLFNKLEKSIEQMKLRLDVLSAESREPLNNKLGDFTRHLRLHSLLFDELLVYTENPNNDRNWYQETLKNWAQVCGEFITFRMIAVSTLPRVQLSMNKQRRLKTLLNRTEKTIKPKWFDDISAALNDGDQEEMQRFRKELEDGKTELGRILDDILEMAYSSPNIPLPQYA